MSRDSSRARIRNVLLAFSLANLASSVTSSSRSSLHSDDNNNNGGDAFEIPSFFDERLNDAFGGHGGSSIFALPAIKPSSIEGNVVGAATESPTFSSPEELGEARGHRERDANERDGDAAGVQVAALLGSNATPSGDNAKQDAEQFGASDRSDEHPGNSSPLALRQHDQDDAGDESPFEGRQNKGNQGNSAEAAVAAFLDRLPPMKKRLRSSVRAGESTRRKFTPGIDEATQAVDSAADESVAAFKKELDDLIRSESISKSQKVKPGRSGVHSRRPPGLRRRGPSALQNSNPAGSRPRLQHGVNRPRVRLPSPPPPVSASAGAGGSSGFIPISPPSGKKRFKAKKESQRNGDGFATETIFGKVGIKDGAISSQETDESDEDVGNHGPPYTTLSEILGKNTTRVLDEGKDNAYSTLLSPIFKSVGNTPTTSSASPISLIANAVAEQSETLPPFIAKIVEEKLTEEDHALLSSLRSQRDCTQKFTDDLCLEVGDYPRKQILRSIARSGHLVDFSLAEIDQQNADMLLEGVSSAQENRYTYDHYFGVTKAGLENHKHRDFAAEGGFLCPSDIKYARPQIAKSAARTNEWKYIVNVGQYTQTVRLEKCLKPMDSCSYVSYHYKSECSQVYNFQRLLSWTPDIGIHMDIYKVPVACSCHIKGYSYQYPPITSTTDISTINSNGNRDGKFTDVSGNGEDDQLEADTEEPFSLQEELQPYEDHVPHTLFYPVQPDLFRPPNRFKPSPPISLFSSPASGEASDSFVGPGAAGGDSNAQDFFGRSPWRRRPTFSHQSPINRVDDMDAAGSEFIQALSKAFPNGNNDRESAVPAVGSDGSPGGRLKAYRRVNYTYHPIVDFMSRRIGEPRSLKRSSTASSKTASNPQIDTGLTDFLLGKSGKHFEDEAELMSGASEEVPVIE